MSEGVFYYIKPREGVFSLFTSANMAEKRKGKLVETQERYGKVLAPKSKQRIKPCFITAKMKFPFTKTETEVNALVEQCNLVHEKGTSFEGQPIKSANPSNRMDAFLNHGSFSIVLNEGNYNFNMKDPKELLIIDALQAGADPRVALYEPGRTAYPKEVQFLLYRSGDEKKKTIKKAKSMMEFFRLIAAKDQKELYVLATAMDINADPDESADDLIAYIYTKLQKIDESKIDPSGKKEFDKMMDLLKLGTGAVKIKYYIQRALKDGRGKLLRYDVTTDSFKIKELDTRTKTIEELEIYLKDPRNATTLNVLQQAFEVNDNDSGSDDTE